MTPRIPKLAPGFRLQWEPVQNAHVLLYPEGMVKLNASAGEILKRCNGELTIEAVIEDLEATFNRQGLKQDVRDFIVIATNNGWLETP